MNALAVVAPPPTPSVRRGVRTLLPARRYCALSFARSSLPIASKNAGSMSAKFAGSADIGSCDGVTGASADVDASSISPRFIRLRDVRPAGLGVDARRPAARAVHRARHRTRGVAPDTKVMSSRASVRGRGDESSGEVRSFSSATNVRLSCTATTRTGLASFSFNQTRSTRPRGSVRLTSTSPPPPPAHPPPPRAPPQRPARPTPPSYPSRRASATSRRTDPGRRRRRRRKTRARRRGAARRRSSVSPGRRT